MDGVAPGLLWGPRLQLGSGHTLSVPEVALEGKEDLPFPGRRFSVPGGRALLLARASIARGHPFPFAPGDATQGSLRSRSLLFSSTGPNEMPF